MGFRANWEGFRANWEGFRSNLEGFRASWEGLRASWRVSEPAGRASESGESKKVQIETCNKKKELFAYGTNFRAVLHKEFSSVIEEEEEVHGG